MGIEGHAAEYVRAILGVGLGYMRWVCQAYIR